MIRIYFAISLAFCLSLVWPLGCLRLDHNFVCIPFPFFHVYLIGVLGHFIIFVSSLAFQLYHLCCIFVPLYLCPIFECVR